MKRLYTPAAGLALLGVSTLGVVLNGAVFPRRGRLGSLLQVVSTGILFVRVIYFTLSGIPWRQRALPRLLTFAEIVVDGVATALGLRVWLASRRRPAADGGVATARRVSTGAGVLSFVIHTARLGIYLTPGRGLRAK